MKKIISAIIFLILLLGNMGISTVADNSPDFIIKEVTVTAYSPSPHITQGDPFVMASGKRATPIDLYQLKYVAVSRDLMQKYGIEYGDIIFIGFQVQDCTSAKIKNTVDIFMRNLSLARKFGRQTRQIIIFKGKQ